MFEGRGKSLHREAIVLSVDIKRGSCKCRTFEGHFLSEVEWARPVGTFNENGDNFAPLPGEVVVLSIILGRPIIQFSLGTIQSVSSSIRSRINGAEDVYRILEQYNPGSMRDFHRREGSAPDEMILGDRLITNDRGGVMGLLRGGSALIKASGLAQIFLTRIDDLVRIVSRNFEHFSDSATEVQVNVKNRVYRFLGVYRTSTSARANLPDFYQVQGDVEVGGELKDKYLDSDISGIPTGGIVLKQVVPQYNGQGEEISPRWEDSLGTDGERVLGSFSGNGDDTSVVEHRNDSWKVTVTDSSGNSFVVAEAASITLDSGQSTEITLNGAAGTILIKSDLSVSVETSTASVTSDTCTVTSTGPVVIQGSTVDLN